jgi:uncharacterized membrane protein
MRHGHYFPFFSGPWSVALVFLGLVVLAAGIIWLVHRRTVVSDGLTPLERKQLSFQEREIISLLRQHGGPMRQDQIIDVLPVDCEDLAEVIKDLETKGLIHRQWKTDLSTYIVSTQSQGMMNECYNAGA